MLQTSAFHSVCHNLATSEEKTAQKTAWPPLEHVTAGIRNYNCHPLFPHQKDTHHEHGTHLLVSPFHGESHPELGMHVREHKGNPHFPNGADHV
jgi:hypothetical protein